MSKPTSWAKVFAFLETTDYHFKKGNFYASQSSRKQINDEVHTAVMSHLKEFVDKKELIQATTKYLSNKTAEDRQGLVIYEDARELVEAFIKAKNIHAGGRGDLLKIDKHYSSLEDVQTKLRVFTQDYNTNIPKDPETGKSLGVSYMPKYIEDVFIDFLIDKDHQYKEDVNARLKHDGTNADVQVLELLDILNIETDLYLSCEALKHWLWLVKRRLIGLPVNDELMLAIKSAQGVGKTYVSRELTKPLDDYYAEADLSSLADAREVSKWSRYYIINFEELSKTDGAQSNGHFSPKVAETIKKVLTQEDFLTRAMRSHKQFKHKRTFTAWATTNVSIVDVLGDETGMRRFFQIESRQEAGKQYDHDRVAKYDFLALWKSIDENLERGYLFSGSEYWEKLQEVQKTYIPKTQIDLFMSDGAYKPAEDISDARYCLSPIELYQYFKDFCEEAGVSKNYVMGFKKFKDRIPTDIPRKGDVFYMDDKEGAK